MEEKTFEEHLEEAKAKIEEMDERLKALQPKIVKDMNINGQIFEPKKSEEGDLLLPVPVYDSGANTYRGVYLRITKDLLREIIG